MADALRLIRMQEAEQLRQGEVVELEIPGAPEYVGIVRHAVEGVARRMQFAPTDVEDLKLAVGEACTNAVKHGCARNGCTSVFVKCTVLTDGLAIEVRNWVAARNSPEVPDRPDLNKEGGLGLYLMRQLVDEVDFRWDDETATVRLVKKLSIEG